MTSPTPDIQLALVVEQFSYAIPDVLPEVGTGSPELLQVPKVAMYSNDGGGGGSRDGGSGGDTDDRDGGGSFMN